MPPQDQESCRSISFNFQKVKYPDTMGEENKESSPLRRILMGTFLHEISRKTIRIIPGLQGLFGEETLKFPYKKI